MAELLNNSLSSSWGLPNPWGPKQDDDNNPLNPKKPGEGGPSPLSIMFQQPGGASDPTQAPQAPQGTPALGDVTTPANALGDVLGQGNGQGYVNDVNNSTGNYLGHTQGKSVDADAKPVSQSGIVGNPNSVNGYDRVEKNTNRVNGNTSTTVTSHGLDGTDSMTNTLRDKNNQIKSQYQETVNGGTTKTSNTVLNDQGQVVLLQTSTKDADGERRRDVLNKQDGSVRDQISNLNKEGVLTDTTITETAQDGSSKVTSQTRNPDGTYTSVSKQFDVQGKEVGSTTEKLDSKLQKPETPQEKAAHPDGSLGDLNNKIDEKEKPLKEIQSKQAQIEKDTKVKAEKALSEKSEKYQKLTADEAALDAKIKDEKDPEKKEKLEAKKAKIASKKSSMIDSQTEKQLAKNDTYQDLKKQQKTTEKSLSKDEDYQKLQKDRATEQAVVDQYKDFNLTDASGKKLSDVDISDRKKDLFGDDGKPLDREALKAKGINASYTPEAVAKDPARVLQDKNATPQEKEAARDAALIQTLRGGQPVNETPQEAKERGFKQKSAIAASAMLAFNDAIAQQKGFRRGPVASQAYNTSQQFVPASQRRGGHKSPFGQA